MREQRTNTRKGRLGSRPAISDQQARDLLNFVSGQDHQPDVALQHDDLRQTVVSVMDDELVSSMEAVVEDALFSDHVSVDRIQEYTEAYMLLKKLRDLQKTRLRDALDAFLNPTKS
ncbi:MAG: hypothetical protein JNL05_00430 [Flavobacteriales bacterium]|nr:hypothetical protein [Flavobacteriales bacterium]